MADGATPSSAARAAGFVNVVTKSGTNDAARHGALLLQERRAVLGAQERRRLPGRQVPLDQQQSGATLGGPLEKDKLFFFLAYDTRAAARRSRPTRARIEQRVVDYFASSGSPDENGPDRPHQRRARLPRQGRLAREPEAPLHAALQLHLERAAERHLRRRLVGPQRQRVERDHSNAVTGSLISTLTPTLLNEFRFQFAREDRPRPYDGPNIAGQSRPLPDTAFDFGSSYRFGDAVLHPGRLLRHAHPVQRQRLVIKGRHTFKAGAEFNRVNSTQTFLGFANGRYIFGTTDGFLNYARTRSTSSARTAPPADRRLPGRRDASPGRCCSSCSRRASGGLTAEEAGTQASRRSSRRSSSRTSGSRRRT